MKPEEILARMQAAIDKAKVGNDAAAATRNGSDTPAVTKDINNQDPFSAKEAANPGLLSKCFLDLARADKQFHFLGADKALEDPQGFLRRKHGPEAGFQQGNYVIPDSTLEAMIGTLLSEGRGKKGITLQEWMMGGADPRGQTTYNKSAQAIEQAVRKGAFGEHGNLILKAALDTTTGGPLIRVDLDPLIYEAYLRDFPAAEVIRRVPANGILHTFNQRTSPGTATAITDLGDMSAAATNSVFGQLQNSHIATLVSPRAIGLKFRYAVQQSGMNYNVEGNDNLEITGAITALAKKNESLMLQGNFTTAGKTLSDEEGLSNVLEFDGYRILLKGGTTSLTKASGDTFVDAINRGVGQIMNSGGSVRNLMILLSVGARFAVNQELNGFVRITNTAPQGGFPANVSANGIVTLGDWPTKMLNIPADAQATGLGFYTFSGNPTEDIDIIDPNGSAFAYLGSPNPTILELPIGFNNQLSQVYYPFLMNGLVLYIPIFNRKIRVPQQTL